MSDETRLAPTHKCSFCDKNNNQVKHMIVGPGVSICDECVLLCIETIFGRDKPEGKDESGA
ncbi:hypothetical protein KVQ01_11365 [Escherichia coli]|uniref:ClpX C4-type zinc finger protein n=1 Tax=Escherichia coli TaxID=562 RepID=UPI001F054C41|nr:ClpX C4-type zinc finger protein [Escherichia coli]MCH0685618.1 hypothetical protein [Escherichia coli]MDZ8667118.1 ClpX C4-type zinc finger protein [Escherichia coli]WRX87700.1 ClpX C4-type zinc finger protein [Escherichia coli]